MCCTWPMPGCKVAQTERGRLMQLNKLHTAPDMHTAPDLSESLGVGKRERRSCFDASKQDFHGPEAVEKGVTAELKKRVKHHPGHWTDAIDEERVAEVEEVQDVMDWDQADTTLAKAAGVHPSTIWRWRKLAGAPKPTLRKNEVWWPPEERARRFGPHFDACPACRGKHKAHTCGRERNAHMA